MGFFDNLSRIGKAALNKLEEIGDKASLDELISNWCEIKNMPTNELQSLIDLKNLSDTRDHERLQLMIVLLYKRDRTRISRFIEKKSTGNYHQDVQTVKRNILNFCNSDIIKNSDNSSLDDLKIYAKNIVLNDFRLSF